MTLDELRRKSAHYRRGILSFVYQAGAGHIGGSLSCVDIINVLHNTGGLEHGLSVSVGLARVMSSLLLEA